MTKFEDFLKKGKTDVSNMEKMMGTFGCKTCELDVSEAYFDANEIKIIYVCENGHESVIQIV